MTNFVQRIMNRRIARRQGDKQSCPTDGKKIPDLIRNESRSESAILNRALFVRSMIDLLMSIGCIVVPSTRRCQASPRHFVLPVLTQMEQSNCRGAIRSGVGKPAAIFKPELNDPDVHSQKHEPVRQDYPGAPPISSAACW